MRWLQAWVKACLGLQAWGKRGEQGLRGRWGRRGLSRQHLLGEWLSLRFERGEGRDAQSCVTLP